MADTDVKSPNPLGATLPPSPSSPAVALESPIGPPLRIKQLQPLPVTSRVYHAIAEVTGGFERLVQDLQALEQFNFIPADDLRAWLNMLLHIQAQTNSHLIESLSSREMNNMTYYERLCMEWERQLKDPDDVFIEAEQRRREIAAEEKRREQDLEAD
jgi:hypothetical protein